MSDRSLTLPLGADDGGGRDEHKEGTVGGNTLPPSSSPASPRLEPSSPRGSSNISSLNMSLDLGAVPGRQTDVVASDAATQDDGAGQPGQEPISLEIQTLMQMLSLVGSRIWEADQLGLEPAIPDDNSPSAGLGDDEEEDSMASSGELSQPGGSSTGRRDAAAAIPTPLTPYPRRLGGVRSQLLEEQTTPRGGRTPLAASVHHNAAATATGVLRDQPNIRSLLPDRGEDTRRASSGTPLRRTSSDSSGSPASSDDGGAEGEGEEQSSPAASQHLGDERSDANAGNASTRAEALSARIQSIFNLPTSEKVQSCYSCWLFRSILLQGTVFLTTGHVLFYAYLPSKEDHIVKTGTIRKRTQKTYRFSRHWGVLRGRALSWYDSQRDPYFPQDHIDLRDVLATSPSTKNPRHFRVQTPYRTFIFGVDSEDARNDWVNAIRRAAFRAQNAGESVRISIPLEAVVDLESTAGQDHSDNVCLQVVDTEADDFALDEYYFLQFARHEEFVAALKTRVQEQLAAASGGGGFTHPRRRSSGGSIRNSTESVRDLLTDANEGVRERLIDPRRDPTPATAIEIQRPTTRATRNSFEISGDAPADAPADAAYSVTPRARTSGLESMRAAHGAGGDAFGYPPSAAAGQPPAGLKTQPATSVLPRWVKDVPSRLLSGSPTLAALMGRRRGVIRPIREVWSGPLRQQLEHSTPVSEDLEQSASFSTSSTSASSHSSPQPGGGDLSASQSSAFSMLEAGSEEEGSVDEEPAHDDVQRLFSLSSEDRLLNQLGATLYRLLPIGGTLYITTRHLCFNAAQLATKTVGRTRMVLPFSEIISCVKHSAFRFGQHGLVLTVRGHEELFLELPSRQRRDQCIAYIEQQIDIHRGGEGEGASSKNTAARTQQERSDAVILTDLSRGDGGDAFAASLPSPSSSQQFEDTSLSALRPKTPKHFTILTIGSRGDVQPFVALAKGLVAEGHRVRLATHAEFGPWITQHGVEFREIGGDPAELMRICVENGTFTLSFFREGVTKFRGWLDDLLVSCWDACQGTDVIIENPNALAGIHIAEALCVPYFRAFTMPWSRTRAYPQAFAVPNKKAGGNYNYMTYVIFDKVLWTASSFQINRWRRACLGLEPTNLDKLEQYKTPFLYNFSPNLVPKPLDWSDWIHVTGFWFLDNPETSGSKPWSPPDDLVAFIKRAKDAGKKLVYVGWGSITVPDAAGTTRCVVDALRKSGVAGVLSKGWSDRLSKGKAGEDARGGGITVGDDIFQIESAPHDWLFPQMDAACHHGGAGTLGASLRAGIPTIIKPYFGDQFFYGQQVESLGVGSCVRELTVDALAAAITTATQNSKQIDRAQALGRQIRAEKGVENAIRAIYADLDYATSLIKRDGSTRAATTTTTVPASRFSSTQVSRSSSCARDTSATSGDEDAARRHVTRGRSRANSAHTTSDEWSVVSGSEEGA